MEHDRQKYGQDPTFTQLFVARSKRLCRYVSATVGADDRSTFETFDELIYEIDTTLPRLENNDRHFYPSQRVDFQRYKQEFHGTHSSKEKGKKETISAMILWTGQYHHVQRIVQPVLFDTSSLHSPPLPSSQLFEHS